MLTVQEFAQKFVDTYTPDVHCKQSFARTGPFPNASCPPNDPEATQWCALGYRDYLLSQLYSDPLDVDFDSPEFREYNQLGHKFTSALRDKLPHGLTVVWANDRENGYELIMNAARKVAENE